MRARDTMVHTVVNTVVNTVVHTAAKTVVNAVVVVLLSIAMAVSSQLVPGGAGAARATSDDPCPQTTIPASRTVAWFNTPGNRAPSEITRGLVQTICAAAAGAEIRVAVFFVFLDSAEVERIFDALRFVHEQRGVRVSFVLDRSAYRTEARQEMLRSIGSVGGVVTCTRGCRSVGVGGVAHNKFVVVSDTVWFPGVDPVVVLSTANWSNPQLLDLHQSAVRVWDDPALARELTIRWSSLRVCATVGCGAWNAQLARRGLNSTVYRVALVGRAWVDPGLGERPGTPGLGTHVSFTPTAGADLIASQLDAFRCTGSHDTVRVGQLQVSRPGIIAVLDRLQTRGCNVKVLVSALSDPIFVEGVAAMRAVGLPVRCVEGLHTKYVHLDAVNRRTGQPQRMLWVGSQNLGRSGLRLSDNTTLRLTPNTPSAIARRENGVVLNEFAANFDLMGRNVVSCPV